MIKGIFTLSSLPCIRQSVGLLFEDKDLRRIKKKNLVSAQVSAHPKDLPKAKRMNFHLEQTVGYC